MTDKINRLVGALPERYQPIYGFDNFTSDAERESSDRLEIVMNIANLMVNHLQRPIRVLDLGCAQGYFSLNLANVSESVTGIDYLDKNVELCSGLAEYHHFEHVKFYENDIATFVSTLKPDDYDLVLGLNVFHHVSYALGYAETKKIIKKIAQNSKVLLTELALKDEPLYWAEALPDNVYSNLDTVAFQYTLQKFATHLSSIERPFIFSSDYMWCDGQNIGEFTSWKNEPHEYSNGYHLNSRRYFFSESKVIKCYYFNSAQKENNIREFQREYDYFNSGYKFPTFMPQILSCTKNEWQGLVVLEKIDGKLLSSKINEGDDFSCYDVIHKLLINVVKLEENKLYHNDLRIWNILITNNGELSFIDIGSISSSSKTSSWPFSVFADFIILTRDIAKAKSEDVTAVRYPFLLNSWYEDEKIKKWIGLIWGTSHKNWSFKLFLELWRESEVHEKIEIHNDNFKYWMELVESFLVFNPREEKFTNSLLHESFVEYHNNLSAQVQNALSLVGSVDEKNKTFYLNYNESLKYLSTIVEQLALHNDNNTALIELGKKENIDKIEILERKFLELSERVNTIEIKRQSIFKKIMNKLFPKQ
ncbi:methyltransferase domain-containing protein [Citrobacter youngae]|uniref:methyltransferase domain-containing protein n=1 Tax=Citrobacter youngae TaxID=133448 RepID=UPI00139D8802|nr:methyltransferase domain-containing protein [Citrobacter youngae]